MNNDQLERLAHLALESVHSLGAREDYWREMTPGVCLELIEALRWERELRKALLPYQEKYVAWKRAALRLRACIVPLGPSDEIKEFVVEALTAARALESETE